jgi:hypothetical protein
MKGSQRMGVGVGVGGKGEGVMGGGKAVEVREGMRMVEVAVGMGSGVRAGAQEASNNTSRKATSARFIIIEMALRGEISPQ